MPDAPTIDPAPALAAGVCLDDLFGCWAADPSALQSRLDYLAGVGLAAHVAASRPYVAPVAESRGSVRVLSAEGLMTKRGGSMTGGTVDLRRSVRDAAADPSVRGVVLKIDSPGGTVAGMADLARDVKELAAAKPTFAFVEDMAASGGYWLACACRKIYVNEPLALLGSVGVYSVLYDSSGAADKAGVRPVVARSVPLKGAGVPGDRVTDEQAAVQQELVDGAHAAFRSHVKAARRLTDRQADAVCVGRVWRADAALTLKLHDGFRTMAEVIAEIEGGPAAPGDRPPAAAGFADLVAACPGIDPSAHDDAAFLVDLQTRGVSGPDATAAWCETLKAGRDAARDDLAAAGERRSATETAAAKAKATGGTAGVPDGPPSRRRGPDAAAGDPDFLATVEDHLADGKSRPEAVRAARRADPESHGRHVAALNAR